MAKPRLVITDAATLNPGDLSWAALEACVDLEIYPRLHSDQVLDACRNADLVLTNKVPFDAERLAALPKLHYIGVTATGFNVIDMAAARQHGVAVTNIPAYGPDSVAQFTFALLLSMTLPVAHYRDAVRAGRWASSADFCFYEHSMPELAQWTLGVIGYGAIGQKVCRIARGFGMRVLLVTRTAPDILLEGVNLVGLDDLLAESHVVSLHCPLTEANAGFIDEHFLARMRPGSYFLNTSRGGLVDELALAEALASGHLAGAGLDVLSTEPPSAEHPLVAQANATITPHLAWATHAARSRLLNIAIDNVKAFLAGRTLNRVD